MYVAFSIAKQGAIIYLFKNFPRLEEIYAQWECVSCPLWAWNSISHMQTDQFDVPMLSSMLDFPLIYSRSGNLGSLETKQMFKFGVLHKKDYNVKVWNLKVSHICLNVLFITFFFVPHFYMFMSIKIRE